MIKLKTLLLEATDDIAANRYSWLNPRGVFIPTKNHVKTAEQIIKLYNLRYDPSSEDVYDVLWKLGYVRVINFGNGLVVHNKYKIPNDVQLKKLIQLAELTGDVEIEYDNGQRSGFKLLWSKNNRMENAVLNEHINDYSWLAPNGTFYPTHDHEYTAKQILRKLPLSPMDRDGIEYTPYELMYKYKFLRVVNMRNSSGEGQDLYANNRYNAPTNTQIKALTDLAIEQGYNKIVFVKDKNEYFVIWDKSHQLE